MCKGRVAVKQELFQRHILGDEPCGECDGEVESIIHVLFDCDATKGVWNTSPFRSILNDSPNSLFRSKLVWLAGKLDRHELRVLCAMAWLLWFQRNKGVHEGLSLNASYMAADYVKLVEDYCMYAKKVLSGQPRSSKLSSTTWICPSEGFIKVNVDAHLTNSYMGLGAVARNHRGETVWAAVKQAESVWEVECAEARFGLSMARQLGVTRVWLEGGSSSACEAINNGSRGRSSIWLIYDDISFLSESFDALIFITCKEGR